MLPTASGLVAILLWSCLALLTAASGTIPPFELAAVTFAIGGSLGLAETLARGQLRALRQPLAVWLVGVGGLFGYHALYFAALLSTLILVASGSAPASWSLAVACGLIVTGAVLASLRLPRPGSEN